MVSINDVFGGNSLKAADLQNQECVVVISAVEVKHFDDGSKPIIHLQGTDKVFICNKTNATRIAMLYGDEMDNWIGRQITLYQELVDFQGKSTWGLRVKVGMVTPHQPPAAAQAPIGNAPGAPAPGTPAIGTPAASSLPNPGTTLPADANWDATTGDDIPF